MCLVTKIPEKQLCLAVNQKLLKESVQRLMDQMDFQCHVENGILQVQKLNILAPFCNETNILC